MKTRKTRETREEDEKHLVGGVLGRQSAKSSECLKRSERLGTGMKTRETREGRVRLGSSVGFCGKDRHGELGPSSPPPMYRELGDTNASISTLWRRTEVVDEPDNEYP